MEELERLTRELEAITGQYFYDVVFIDKGNFVRAKKNLHDLLIFFLGRYRIPEMLIKRVIRATDI